ncbi:MAG: efflux RND transporter periplasmic adaptor subunit [Bacteroidetes bacterium]|nr:efflux RND transporter periplasmic adaptor subunit [Bacteroidota bacterium]
MSRITGIVLVLLVLAAAAWFFIARSGKEGGGAASGPNAGVGPRGAAIPIPTIDAITITPKPFEESVNLTGSIVADERVDLRSEISGRVTAISFQEGSLVKKGQVLVQLFDADLRAQLQKSTQQLKLDQDRLHRFQQLRAVDGVSQEDLENAQSNVEIRKAEADVLKAQLMRTQIVAPFSGRIGLRNVSVGTVLTPSMTIATLANEQTLNVECSIPERFAAVVHPGMTLEFRVRGRDTASHRHATIYAMEPAMDDRTRSLRIRARCKEPQGIVAGMFADVALPLLKVSDALLVPSECIIPDNNGTFVFRVRNGHAEKTKVETGGRSTNDVRVTNGLNIGDTVVTTGLLLVKPNLPVKVRIR